MIIKDKLLQKVSSATAKAGQKQEQDVAFYLRRSFKDHKEVFVFNDLKIRHRDEVAQIDHLVLYPYGFILIESKSITGEIKINKHEEWNRSYQDKWQGMPSPIKQLELQQQLLRELLFEHRANIIGLTLFIKQQSFGGRCWNNVCVVSSNAIIHRQDIPAHISNQLVKSEFLADKLKDIMKLRNKFINTLNLLDTRPDFSQNEMDSIAEFLLSQDISGCFAHKTQASLKANEAPNNIWLIKNTPSTQSTQQPIEQINSIQLNCSKCGATGLLKPCHGKYGYYVRCGHCDGNTAMKKTCPQCTSKKTKVTKKKQLYSVNCLDCMQQTPLEIDTV